jgi:hypothetical protein
MATYKISYENDVYPAKSGHKQHVPDNLIREFTTILNASIAKSIALANILLSNAEDGTLEPAEMLQKGLQIDVVQG